MGGQKFFFPPSPSKFRRQTRTKLCNYVGLCVPYKPWKFGDGLWAKFFGQPIWKYGTPVWAIRVKILESGVNSWYSFTSVQNLATNFKVLRSNHMFLALHLYLCKPGAVLVLNYINTVLLCHEWWIEVTHSSDATKATAVRSNTYTTRCILKRGFCI